MSSVFVVLDWFCARSSSESSSESFSVFGLYSWSGSESSSGSPGLVVCVVANGFGGRGMLGNVGLFEAGVLGYDGITRS